jgi:hypothetical protein
MYGVDNSYQILGIYACMRIEEVIHTSYKDGVCTLLTYP